jgi:hypothetical protein
MIRLKIELDRRYKLTLGVTADVDIIGAQRLLKWLELIVRLMEEEENERQRSLSELQQEERA